MPSTICCEARLRSATPDYGWLSEESADDEVRLSRRRTWIVDPIDGTRDYLAGHDEWCVSVALVEDASPVLAAVFAPASDEFFFAARGQGTTLNGSAGAGERRDRARLLPRRRAEAAGRAAQSVTAARSSCIRESVRSRCGCAGSPHGALDAAFAGGNSHDWDLAAADLIVQEADGRMTDLSGDPILYNRREVTHGVLVAAGRDRHARIVAHFRNRPLP